MRHVWVFVAIAASASMLIGCKNGQETQEATVMTPPETGDLQAVRPADRVDPPQPRPTPTYTEPAPTPFGSPDADAADAATPAPEPASPTTRTYTVEKGDTLWSIAKQIYGDGQKWRLIVEANPGLKPEALRIGQTLTIPPAQ
ncbi:MAG: LysM peptidoglycan-binding domain-containing protein [Phycisphaerae bacterium]|nr:LysM peptidoglycan-binding domain-containing protein [Phycisphaerae bacterium]